jgi:hypothetical protein
MAYTKTQGGIRTVTVVTAATDFHRTFPRMRLYFIHIINLFEQYVNSLLKFCPQSDKI